MNGERKLTSPKGEPSNWLPNTKLSALNHIHIIDKKDSVYTYNTCIHHIYTVYIYHIHIV